MEKTKDTVELVRRLVAALQDADRAYGQAGSSPVYVRDCLLPMLYKHGVHIELTCLPDQHQWQSQPRGGDPAEASSREWVTYCQQCGAELVEED